MPLRCLIVDDNASFLAAAASLLEREGVTVVGVASTIADALRKAHELRPDVILVDITIRYESGFDLARRLAGTDPGDTTVILISTHAEAEFADLIEEAPVAGFVAKSELSASAIQRLARALIAGSFPAAECRHCDAAVRHADSHAASRCRSRPVRARIHPADSSRATQPPVRMPASHPCAATCQPDDGGPTGCPEALTHVVTLLPAGVPGRAATVP